MTVMSIDPLCYVVFQKKTGEQPIKIRLATKPDERNFSETHATEKAAVMRFMAVVKDTEHYVCSGDEQRLASTLSRAYAKLADDTDGYLQRYIIMDPKDLLDEQAMIYDHVASVFCLEIVRANSLIIDDHQLL